MEKETVKNNKLSATEIKTVAQTAYSAYTQQGVKFAMRSISWLPPDTQRYVIKEIGDTISYSMAADMFMALTEGVWKD